jgi:hypothetical protein
LQALVQTPENSAQWFSSCNPNFTDAQPGQYSAGRPFSAGFVVSPNYYLIFNRSNNPPASQPVDFTEYLLSPGQDSFLPSLKLVGGIPCIAYSDVGALDMKFLQASSRTDSSAASWFLHTVANSAGNDEHWNPSMCLVEGRPAIAAGYTTIDFHWTGGQFPDSQDDWHSQRAVDTSSGLCLAMASTGGLPIIAYAADFQGQNILHIALASEQ